MNVSQTRWKYLQKNVADLQKKHLNILFIATFFVYLQHETKKIITHRKNRVIYKDSNIHLQRKYERYLKQMDFEKSLSETRTCNIEGCNKKHRAKGYCRNHYYKFCLLKRKNYQV